MYRIRKHVDFSAAHQVLESGGACERLHGHNWKVVAHLEAAELDALGMVIDFKELKRALKAILEPLEHSLLNEVPPFDGINPTSENLARHVYDELTVRLADDRVSIHRVDVWETEASCATYVGEDG